MKITPFFKKKNLLNIVEMTMHFYKTPKLPCVACALQRDTGFTQVFTEFTETTRCSHFTSKKNDSIPEE